MRIWRIAGSCTASTRTPQRHRVSSFSLSFVGGILPPLFPPFTPLPRLDRGRFVWLTTQLPATGFYRTEVWSGRKRGPAGVGGNVSPGFTVPGNVLPHAYSPSHTRLLAESGRLDCTHFCTHPRRHSVRLRVTRQPESLLWRGAQEARITTRTDVVRVGASRRDRGGLQREALDLLDLREVYGRMANSVRWRIGSPH